MSTPPHVWTWDRRNLRWETTMPDGVVLRAQLAKKGRHVNRWLAVIDDETLSWRMHPNADLAQLEALDNWERTKKPKRARRLAAITDWINQNRPELIATIERGYCNTDRKIPGTRLRHAGKGRWGTRLVVRTRGRQTVVREHPLLPQTERVVLDHYAVVLDHNAAETYRSNDEVERWLAAWIANNKR